MLQTVMQT